MKLINNIVLRCMIILYMTESASFASTQEMFGLFEGRVSMQGSIISSSCSIATEDRDQTIDMGVATMGEVIRTRTALSKSFSLHLVNCVFEDNSSNQHFQTTFEGTAKDDLFNVNGASGVSLQISDIKGNIARPGLPFTSSVDSTNSHVLRYVLSLVGNDRHLKAGEYRAALRFKVDYY